MGVLSEDVESAQVIDGVVEPDTLVQRADRLEFLLLEVKLGVGKVSSEVLDAVALGDDSDSTLGAPPQNDLSRGTLMRLCDARDRLVLKQLGGVVCLFPIESDKRQRAKGRVSSKGDVLALGERDELLLHEVGVVLDLEDRGADTGVSEDVHQESTLEVANTDRLGQAEIDQLLEGGPGLLDGGFALDDFALEVLPPAWVGNGGVDVFEGNGEVDEEEIKVVDAPPFELLAGDGLDFVGFVEGVPEFGGDEEVGALDDAFFDGALDTLTALLFVSVIYPLVSLLDLYKVDRTYRKHHRTACNRP